MKRIIKSNIDQLILEGNVSNMQKEDNFHCFRSLGSLQPYEVFSMPK